MTRLHLISPGTYTDANGVKVSLSEADLSASAQAYDPTLHEAPVVIGHPKHSAPAYGWVRTVQFAEGRYEAETHNTVEEFPALIGGPFKKRSARFYTPTSPRNPKPGVYYLRDVGLLGAMPPAIKGLREVEFSEGEDDVLEVAFAETSDWSLSRIFRGLRDYLIETAGTEKADSIIPEWILEEIQLAAMRPELRSEPLMFSEEIEGTVTTNSDPATTDNAREQALQDREAAVAQKEAELARQGHLAFAETLKGKIHPGQKASVVELLCQLDGGDEIAFDEGEAKPAAEIFKTFLSSLPAQVEFGEVAKPTDTVDFSEDPVALAQAAQAYVQEQAAKGITVSVSDAVQKVSQKKS